MDLTLSELSEFVIVKSPGKELSDGTLDLESLNILMVMSDPKKVAAVTKAAGYELEAVKDKILMLIREGLVDVVDGKNIILETAFIKHVQTELAKSVGPLAAILMEDVADELGYEITLFPSAQAHVLIGQLIGEIQREDQAAEFKRNVTAEYKLYQK